MSQDEQNLIYFLENYFTTGINNVVNGVTGQNNGVISVSLQNTFNGSTIQTSQYQIYYFGPQSLDDNGNSIGIVLDYSVLTTPYLLVEGTYYAGTITNIYPTEPYPDVNILATSSANFIYTNLNQYTDIPDFWDPYYYTVTINSAAGVTVSTNTYNGTFEYIPN